MITFNNIKEADIPGLFLKDRKILAPTKQKIKVTVPFMHGAYDFSTVGSGGEIVYTQRNIECKFGIKASSKAELQVRYKQFLAWIYDVGQSQLMFDDLAGVYFLAEVEKEPSWQETYLYAETAVTFVCEPFAYELNDNVIIKNITTEKELKILNFGTVKSKPIIKLFGTGDITLHLNKTDIILKGVVDYITIDSETMDCYKDTMSCNGKMYGEFPLLQTGENILAWDGNVTKVEIKQNIRYL